MTVSAASLDWAIDSTTLHSDGDLFPRLQELEALSAERNHFTSQIAGKDLGNFPPGAHRRFLVPKDEVSYRQATQLDLQDSILFAALLHQYGDGIEKRRLSADRVYSYRFSPTAAGGLYANTTAWSDFWTRAKNKAAACGTILHCDIADFYNQVYHHEVENQLIAAGFPNQATKWIVALIESTTAGVSRGVPVGPHPAHLIAEATLIPVDESLRDSGLDVIRYADDFIVFCRDKRAAKSALATLARVLDQPQRLMLQRHKTRFYERASFEALCDDMVEDRPIDSAEKGLLTVVRKYSGGNPYAIVRFSQIDTADWQAISSSTLRSIIEQYLAGTPTDYIRLRWLYRRLAQIGHPGAIEVSLDRIADLAPCFSSICFYIAAAQQIDAATWQSLGKRLLDLLDSHEVQDHEYFALLLISLFARNSSLNHFARLAQRFSSSSPSLRREILLTAKTNGADGWLRQHKQSFVGMDSWQQLAYIYGCSAFPPDEKKYFIQRWNPTRPVEKTLAKWSKNV